MTAEAVEGEAGVLLEGPYTNRDLGRLPLCGDVCGGGRVERSRRRRSSYERGQLRSDPNPSVRSRVALQSGVDVVTKALTFRRKEQGRDRFESCTRTVRPLLGRSH